MASRSGIVEMDQVDDQNCTFSLLTAIANTNVTTTIPTKKWPVVPSPRNSDYKLSLFVLSSIVIFFVSLGLIIVICSSCKKRKHKEHVIKPSQVLVTEDTPL